MRCLACVLIFVLAAPALWGVMLQRKVDDREFPATVVALEDGVVTYRRGRTEHRTPLDDFTTVSKYRIRREFCRSGADWLGLARFALHRDLYPEAIEAARRAGESDAGLSGNAEQLIRTARALHADALLEEGRRLLDEEKPAEARSVLAKVAEEYEDTPAFPMVEVLLGTVARVEMVLKARELEQAARQAQAEADAEERRRRAPSDEWLAEVEAQAARAAELKAEGDADCAAGQTSRGLPKYQNAVRMLGDVRKSLEDMKTHLTFPGQPERVEAIDKSAVALMVDTYDRWVHFLFQMERFEAAQGFLREALKLAPGDRRLLLHKVDLDEALHGLNR